jgi:hypothetical protein
MVRIPVVEISTIKRVLGNQGINCKKEIEFPGYGLYRYACDFDTKGEQSSGIGVEWFRLKYVDDKDPHLEPTKDYEYVDMESVIVVPRTKEGFCPREKEEKNKIKYMFIHDSPSSCYHHFKGIDVDLEDITQFINNIKNVGNKK